MTAQLEPLGRCLGYRLRLSIGSLIRSLIGHSAGARWSFERADAGFDFLIALRDHLLVVGIGPTRMPQRQQMLPAPVALQRLDQRVAARFDAPVGQLGQPRRILFTGQDGVGYGQPGHPGQVGDGMVQMDVHLAVRLLHVLYAARRSLDQGVAMAQHGA